MYKAADERRTEQVNRHHTKEDKDRPEEDLVDWRMMRGYGGWVTGYGEGEIPEGITGDGDGVGGKFRHVAKEDYPAHKGSEGANAEGELRPALVATKEDDTQNRQRSGLQEAHIWHHEHTKGPCEGDREIGTGLHLVHREHVKPILVVLDKMVEAESNDRQCQENQCPKDGVANIAPEFRIAEQEGEFENAVYLRDSAEHDDTNRPEGFVGFEVDERQ